MNNLSTPKTLQKIYTELGFQPKFRVRNVMTLKDYLILKVHKWSYGVATLPAVLDIYDFAENKKTFCEADEKEYCALSTRREAGIFQRYSDNSLINLCVGAYAKTDLVERYYPFGMGDEEPR